MSEQRPRRPNVIWFFADQHRGQAMRCAGDPNVSTPNLDALAAGGVRFTRAISGNPWCTPFHGSLLTGRYPQHCVQKTPQHMDPSIRTVAHAFERAGYETAYFGKWHLGRDRSDPLPVIDGVERHDAYLIPRGERGGFHTWIGYESLRSSFDVFVHGHTPTAEVELHKLDRFETDALTDILIAFIRQQAAPAKQPFFAVCSVKPPHDPYVAPDEWMRRYNPDDIELRPNVPSIPWMRQRAQKTLAGYYALIENIDHNVGRLMSVLNQTGLSRDTLVVYFSDHGDMHWSHGYSGKSVPWEESIRIPFIVSGCAVPPGAAGRRVDPLLNTVDIAPTTFGLAGIEVPDEMPGFDYGAYVTDPDVAGPLPGEPDSAFIQHLVHKPGHHNMDCTWRGVVRRDGWKYVCTENAHLGMFDLNDDPYEEHNLVFKGMHKDKRRELIGRLRQWIADTGDAYPVPPSP